MMKVLFLSVAALALAGGWSVAAQTSLMDLQARNASARTAARQEVLSTQMEATAAQERARSQVLLRDLNDQRVAGSSPQSSLTVPPPHTVDDANQRDADLTASMDRLDRLTQDAMAQSNARMRAITPASQPKTR